MRSSLGRRPAWIPVGVLLLIAPLPAFPSEHSDETVYGPTDTVEVAADRPDWEARIEGLPFFASVRDLEDASTKLLGLADILEEEAGVRIRRYGGLGSYATASIRASAPGQVEVLLDGIPLSSAQWGAANLAELPLTHLERAEIYRSGAPAEFGSPGIGGVVNLVTKPAGGDRTTIAVSGGSYETWKTSFLRSGRAAGGGYLLSYHHVQTKGDFEFLYDPGTSVWNSADDTLLTRRNNSFREHALLAKADLPPILGWRFSVHDNWYLKESGLPGHGNLLYDEASFDNRRHALSMHAASPGFFGRRLRADWTGYLLYRRDRYYNPGNEPTLHRSDLFHRTSGRGFAALLTAFSFRTNQRFRLGAEWRRERFTPEDTSPGVGKGFPRQRDALAITAEDRLALFHERLALLASYRYQRWEDNFHGYNPYIPQPEAREEPFRTEFHAPTFGARAELTPFLTIQGSRSHYARPPTLYELFGTNGDARPNPDLVPEEGVTWDGGFQLRSSDGGFFSGRVELSLFHSERDSLIYFIQNSQRNFKAVNLEEATVRGLEIQMSGRAGSRLRIDFSFTSQDARHHGTVPQWDDKWLPYVSPRELSSRVSVRLGRFTLRHEYLFLDRYYRDRANLEKDRARARHIHNLGAEVSFLSERITADLDIRNVGDDRASDSFGYPMPGRTVYLSLQFEIRDL